jgi:membrane protein DedA with SNARE-associated domain
VGGRPTGEPMVAGIAEWILSLSGAWALAVVFLGPALESSAFVGIVFPGEIAVILGGVLAYHGRISLGAAIVAAVLGAIVGDTVGYWVGREWGNQVLRWIGRRLPFLAHRIDDDLERARSFIQRRGGVAVLIGRFAAALRATVPGLAGLSDMHYPTFLAFNALGGAIWGTSFVLLGYVAGEAWQRAAGYASRIGFGVLALIVLGLVGNRVLRNVRDHGEPVPDRLANVRPVAAFRRLYPGASGWLARRVDTSSPRGFALSLSAAAAALGAWLFGAMLQDVIGHDDAALFDPRVARFVAAHRTAVASSVAHVAWWLGSMLLLVPVVAAGVVWFYRRRGRWAPAAVLGLSLVASSALSRVAQALVARPLPSAGEHLMSRTPSTFPSAHAAQAVAGWGALAILAAFDRSFRARVLMAVAIAALATLVAAADVVLGDAWFTDALAGIGLGAASVCASAALLCVLSRRGGAPPPPGTPEPVEAFTEVR